MARAEDRAKDRARTEGLKIGLGLRNGDRARAEDRAGVGYRVE